MDERTVYFLRHGEAGHLALDDRQRPLTDPGRAQARGVGQLLVTRGVTLDVVVVSDALRTRQTWQEVSGAGVEHGPVVMSDRLYDAGVDDIIEVLRRLPPTAGTALVVGHYPGIPDAVLELAQGEGDADSWAEMSLGFPTATLARLEVTVRWADLVPGTARLASIDKP